jgi:ribonuclease HII
MPWQVGIDEAGYGPNLGPFVMSVVAVRAPAADACPWALLRDCVRRHDEEDDGRLVVADSKQVYSTARGVAELERGVLGALRGGFFAGYALDGVIVRDFLPLLCAEDLASLQDECWYAGTRALPLAADALALLSEIERLKIATGEARLTWGFCRSAVVCAPRFNDLVDRWDSKAIVPTLSLVRLIRACVAALPDEPIRLVVDKQGGRNRYGAMLQEAFPGGIVRPVEEGADRSVYRVECLSRPVEVVFEPRADDAHFPVALASMVSKYLREVLMAEFNAFWQTHVPGVKPTAGYPGDAARFFDEIRPTARRLGLTDRQLWRQR